MTIPSIDNGKTTPVYIVGDIPANYHAVSVHPQLFPFRNVVLGRGTCEIPRSKVSQRTMWAFSPCQAVEVTYFRWKGQHYPEIRVKSERWPFGSIFNQLNILKILLCVHNKSAPVHMGQANLILENTWILSIIYVFENFFHPHIIFDLRWKYKTSKFIHVFQYPTY